MPFVGRPASAFGAGALRAPTARLVATGKTMRQARKRIVGIVTWVVEGIWVAGFDRFDDALSEKTWHESQSVGR